MDKANKTKCIETLRNSLIYPETLDNKTWEKAEIINQKILLIINQIIELPNENITFKK